MNVKAIFTMAAQPKKKQLEDILTGLGYTGDLKDFTEIFKFLFKEDIVSTGTGELKPHFQEHLDSFTDDPSLSIVDWLLEKLVPRSEEGTKRGDW